MKKRFILVILVVLVISLSSNVFATSYYTCYVCAYPNAEKWCNGQQIDDPHGYHEVSGFPGYYCEFYQYYYGTSYYCSACWDTDTGSHLCYSTHSCDKCTCYPGMNWCSY